MAGVGRLRVYPVKGLDGVDVETAEIVSGGTLAFDREFALHDGSGDVVNGKRTDRVHELATDFDRESGRLGVETADGETRQFHLVDERAEAERWFSDFFDAELTLRRDGTNGFVDRREMGPSVVSTATLRAVASWFGGVSVESARRRLRANVEIADVPPFWEDRFAGPESPDFEIAGVRFGEATPCARCIVPQRDPDTGELSAGFRDRFVRKREETFPDWADQRAFDHYYAAMVITRIPESDRDGALRVGNPVAVVE